MRPYYSKLIPILAAALLPAIAQAESFKDPLDVPAAMTERAVTSFMQSAAKAGSHLVAVGELGRILISSDEGRTWEQVASPVSADLVSVEFSSESTGWATGHGGVLLRTEDGGRSWKKVFDGRDVAELMHAYYQQRLDQGDESAASILRDVELSFQNGPELPFLDIWFGARGEGFVVGAFGLILGTQDGGNSWTPWLDRIDNPQVLHLNAVNNAGDDVYIVGERGMIWKLDAEAQRFVPQPSDYAGSFFGITGNSANVVVFGLRGNAYRSSQTGESWHSLSLPTQASLNDGATLDDGTLVLVTQNGEVVTGPVDGSRFSTTRVARPTLLAGVVPVSSNIIVVAGMNGMQRQELVPAAQTAQVNE